MQKIPTVFERDETVKGHPVIDRVTPGCEWVLAGDGFATVKMDGTNVKVEGGVLFKRQKPKDRDYDEANYVPCDRKDPADQWAWEAFDAAVEPGGAWHSDVPPADGIYELLGPKIQKNPYGYEGHMLVRVFPMNWELRIPEPERTFAGLREALADGIMEGIVFHSLGRLAKIKRRDFGLPWPIKEGR